MANIRTALHPETMFSMWLDGLSFYEVAEAAYSLGMTVDELRDWHRSGQAREHEAHVSMTVQSVARRVLADWKPAEGK